MKTRRGKFYRGRVGAWAARPRVDANTPTCGRAARAPGNRGSILIIVLWIAFGLVTIALYFANSMALELRASDNRVASLEAEQAIAGAANYVAMILSNTPSGSLPDPQTYRAEAVSIGDAKFWLIGRDTNDFQTGPTQMSFGLVDEASKVNLNMANYEAEYGMLLQLLNNSQTGFNYNDLVANIVGWKLSQGGEGLIEDSGGSVAKNYSLLPIPYSKKEASFETIDELRLVY